MNIVVIVMAQQEKGNAAKQKDVKKCKKMDVYEEINT